MKRLCRVYLIRHGQTIGFENYPVYGHTDVELTETGILQMQQISERLRLVPVSAVYSSNLKRTVAGARLVAGYHDVPINFLPELREMYFGDWEGLTLSEIRSRFPEEMQKRQEDLLGYRIPGEGESIDRFSERIMTCFKRILVEEEGDDIVVVAHGGVNRMILCNALGMDLNSMFNIHQDYGCLNIIDYFSDFTQVRLMNG
mgnify:CR=1 FL=1